VTDPHNPQFLWEFADPDLFRSRSSPAVGQIGRIVVDGVAKWVAFFVSGKTYDTTLYPSIYMIDIADGSLIDRIYLDSVAAGQGGVPSGQPAIVDSDGNGYIDRLYIGTDKGRLYKVNFSDDPDNLWAPTTTLVVNSDFSDDDGSLDGLGDPYDVPVDQRWHPIYASPAVVVDNRLAADGTIDYQVRIFFGTGDSPYFDEGIDMGNTTYHFFAYLDHAPKAGYDPGRSVNPDEIELDWFFALPAGQRIFASAFAAAGKIYFGTATSETEDPCDGSNGGQLFSFDAAGYGIGKPAVPDLVVDTGDITSSPLVEDEHLFIRTGTGMLKVGGGGYNNASQMGGFGDAQPASWREIFE